MSGARLRCVVIILYVCTCTVPGNFGGQLHINFVSCHIVKTDVELCNN